VQRKTFADVRKQDFMREFSADRPARQRFRVEFEDLSEKKLTQVLKIISEKFPVFG